MRLFRRQRHASSGLNRILEESGAPEGSLYHQFPGGKAALAEAAIAEPGELKNLVLQIHVRVTR